MIKNVPDQLPAMTFDANTFKIVYGTKQEEIELQVKKLLPDGYVLHGSIVAQPNANYSKETAGSQSPYIYYQILTRHKTALTPPEAREEGVE